GASRCPCRRRRWSPSWCACRRPPLPAPPRRPELCDPRKSPSVTQPQRLRYTKWARRARKIVTLLVVCRSATNDGAEALAQLPSAVGARIGAHREALLRLNDAIGLCIIQAGISASVRVGEARPYSAQA